MAGNREESPGNGDLEETHSRHGKVHQVFERGEAEAYRRGIDYAVVTLVEIGAFPQQEPEHEQFGGFFRNGGTEERGLQRIQEGGGFFGEHSEA